MLLFVVTKRTGKVPHSWIERRTRSWSCSIRS